MLKEEGLPVVVTLSDFWPICLRHTLLRWDHQVCHSGPVGPLTCLGCAQATYGYPQGSGVETQAALALAQGADYPEHRFAGEVRAVAQRNAVLRACLLAADRLIALSRFAQEKFREHGYPGDRLELLEHGVDALQLAAGRAQRQSQPPAPPLGTLDRPLRLVFMATLAPHKGLHVLLAALEQIPHAPVLLEVYGPDGGGDYPQQLRRSAARDSRISFQGPVSAEKVGEILAQAHVLACPAQWYENDPLVVKSAFSLGVPVVASRLGSLEEMITRSGFGWLLPPTDILAWAAWMEEKAAGGWEPPSPPAAVPTVTSFAAALFPIYQSLCPTL
jgi:glycosyltransferase involved in cell wall biosynthesis